MLLKFLNYNLNYPIRNECTLATGAAAWQLSILDSVSAKGKVTPFCITLDCFTTALDKKSELFDLKEVGDLIDP